MSRILPFAFTVAALMALPLGCTQSTDVADATPARAEGEDHAGHDHAEGEEHEDEEHAEDEGGGHVHVHGAWWCDEHGVPEEVCARCNSKVAADFQRKGDWCKDHERPDSQCFVCHPELEARFANQYEAKYGKKPPKPEA